VEGRDVDDGACLVEKLDGNAVFAFEFERGGAGDKDGKLGGQLVGEAGFDGESSLTLILGSRPVLLAISASSTTRLAPTMAPSE
jgi:hypothetical protein